MKQTKAVNTINIIIDYFISTLEKEFATNKKRKTNVISTQKKRPLKYIRSTKDKRIFSCLPYALAQAYNNDPDKLELIIKYFTTYEDTIAYILLTNVEEVVELMKDSNLIADPSFWERIQLYQDLLFTDPNFKDTNIIKNLNMFLKRVVSTLDLEEDDVIVCSAIIEDKLDENKIQFKTDTPKTLTT